MISYYYNWLFNIIIFVFSIRTQSKNITEKIQILKQNNVKRTKNVLHTVQNRNAFLGANTGSNYKNYDFSYNQNYGCAFYVTILLIKYRLNLERK